MAICVEYRRVSTNKQGIMGLGMEAQERDVAAFIERNDHHVVASYTECETGKTSDRPELKKALAHCRRSGAILVVAKLDRLARNVAFVSALMETGVEFVCVDQPNANKLTIHILAAVAEYEAKMISERTKAGLKSAKARGVKLGSARPGHWERFSPSQILEWRRMGPKTNLQKIELHWRKVIDEVGDMIRIWAEEGRTLSDMAHALNLNGIPTYRNKEWTIGTVKTLVDRVMKNLPVIWNTPSPIISNQELGRPLTDH